MTNLRISCQGSRSTARHVAQDQVECPEPLRQRGRVRRLQLYASSPEIPMQTLRHTLQAYGFSAAPSFGLAMVSESPQELKATEYKWPSRRASGRIPTSRQGTHLGHRPRRSVSDALAKFRNRQGSVSENAQELAEALKAPVSYRLIFLCIAWYMTSALTNTSSKSMSFVVWEDD